MLRFFIKKFLIFLTFFLIIVLMGGVIFDLLYRSDGYIGPISDHFDGKRFSNIAVTSKAEWGSVKSELSGFTTWITTTRPHWQTRQITSVIPVSSYTGSGMKITAIGHATLLIQVSGINILTDPIWTASPSPISWLSHGRYLNPGVAFADLPRIDVILISHNHYDHLDIPTLLALTEVGSPAIYTGLGNSAYLAKNNIFKSTDMDWFQSVSLGSDVSLTFVPSEHYSARGLSDSRRTLWGGFVIEGGGKSLYFAGDSASGAFAEAIKTKYPNGFDIGLLPIGAFRPEYIMKDKHMNPREALELQKNLNIRNTLGIHYGTFALGSDEQDEPMRDLEIAKKDFTTQVFDLGTPGGEWVFE